MKHTLHNICIFFLLVNLVFVIVSCNHSTKPKTGSLNGEVELINDSGDPLLEPLDFSEVEIALYETGKSVKDTQLKNSRNLLINAGFDFDHREHKYIKYGKTDEQGLFAITGIPTGTYHVVVYKKNWGFRYFHNVAIRQGENSLVLNSSNSVITLFPESIISGVISHEIQLLDGHHLIIEDDAFFTPTGSLKLNAGSVLRINKDKTLSVAGLILMKGSAQNPFVVTSNDIFDASLVESNMKINDVGSYLSINLLPGSQIINSLISYGKITYGKQALLVTESSSVSFSDLYVISEQYGIALNGVGEASVLNSIFKGVSGSINIGLYYLLSSNGSVENCVFSDNYTGLKLKDGSNPEVKNNYFLSSEYGLELYTSNSYIHHNDIENCEYGMRICGIASPNILRNNIQGNISIHVGYSGYYPNSTPEIHYNNMNCVSYYYFVQTTSALDINAQNNYHYSSNVEFIRQRIKDKQNYPQHTQNTVGTVYFEPIQTNKISNAGVQQ